MPRTRSASRCLRLTCRTSGAARLRRAAARPSRSGCAPGGWRCARGRMRGPSGRTRHRASSAQRSCVQAPSTKAKQGRAPTVSTACAAPARSAAARGQQRRQQLAQRRGAGGEAAEDQPDDQEGLPRQEAAARRTASPCATSSDQHARRRAAPSVSRSSSSPTRNTAGGDIAPGRKTDQKNTCGSATAGTSAGSRVGPAAGDHRQRRREGRQDRARQRLDPARSGWREGSGSPTMAGAHRRGARLRPRHGLGRQDAAQAEIEEPHQVQPVEPGEELDLRRAGARTSAPRRPAGRPGSAWPPRWSRPARPRPGASPSAQ